MTSRTIRTPMQFGLWPSPLSAKALSQDRKLADVCWDTQGTDAGATGTSDPAGATLVWLESRGDRSVLVASEGGGTGAPRDLTTDLSCRAKVGYGGGDFTVSHGHVYFAEARSGRLYRVSLAGGTPRPITPAFGHASSPRVSPNGKWVLYVHHDSERKDRIAVVDAAGKYWPQIMAEGNDFYAQTRWSSGGDHIAFIAWNFPQMPWDGASLFLAPVQHAGGLLPQLGVPKRLAGGIDVAIFQPEFSADGKAILYVSDESGWGHIHSYELSSGKARRVTHAEDAEHGRPNWQQEMRNFAVGLDGKQVFAAINKRGFVRLWRIDLETGDAGLIDAMSQYTDVSQPALDPSGCRLAVIASAAGIPARVVLFDLRADQPRIVARTSSESLREDEISQPIALSWRATRTDEAHGLYYPPVSPNYTGTGTAKPPLIVIVHGGPTSQVRAAWSPQAQFFASRGYGVLYVNHRGSTGYGREYMLKQRGAWGVVDVEDAVTGAKHLVDTGRADGGRLVIMGGSAGGYTVLQTMVSAPQAFTAGIVLYGIANQFTLVASTHKFEERYSDMLLGTLPEASEIYRERSPVFHADKIKRPLAIFQGDIDEVVPKEQSDAIVKALQQGGTPHLYHVYAGEGHGWRKPETIEHFYQTVDTFLREHVIYK